MKCFIPFVFPYFYKHCNLLFYFLPKCSSYKQAIGFRMLTFNLHLNHEGTSYVLLPLKIIYLLVIRRYPW